MGSAESPQLQIAICGAGIAGLTAAIALRKLPNVSVQIYEQTAVLKEIGASIALGPNGLRTLQRLGLDNAIGDEVGYRGPSNIPMIYKHWKTDEVLGEDYHRDVSEYLHRTARYYRAHLQEALLEYVPSGIVYLGKRFAAAEVDVDGVTVKFEDGTEVRADVLVGADGLRSGVRNFLAPDLKLQWSGATALRAVFDDSIVKDIPNLPRDSIHWWGPSTNFFSSPLGKNQFTVVGATQENPDDPNATYGTVVWNQEASVKAFKGTYADWNPVVKALVEATPNIRCYPNFAVEKSLSSWVFDERITLVGDAAHAHGGAYATGGSLAIDDAYAFSLAISAVFPPSGTENPSSESIGRALRLYESSRKPHADKLLGIVHSANRNKVANIGKLVTDEVLRKVAAGRLDTVWLHEHDVVAAFDEALRSQRHELDVTK